MADVKWLIYLIVALGVASTLLNIWRIARSSPDPDNQPGDRIGSLFGMPIKLSNVPSRKFSVAKVNPRALHLAMAAGIVWYAIDSWLEYKTGWPLRYGINCWGECSLGVTLPHSFALLHRGPYELALFISIWAPWTAVLLLMLWGLRKWLVGEDSSNSPNTDNADGSAVTDNSHTTDGSLVTDNSDAEQA